MNKIRTRRAHRNIDVRQLDLFDLNRRERWNDVSWQARRIGCKHGLTPGYAVAICSLAGIGPQEDR